MAKRGRRQKPGLRWHTTKGWYRLYEAKPKYFGGSGSRENSAIRKNDSNIQNIAEKRWHEHEAEHLFGNTLSTLDRSAGQLKGFRDAAHMITEQVQVGELTDDQRSQLAKRLKISTVRFIHEIASKNEETLGAIQQPAKEHTGLTCKHVTDAYLAYLKAQADREPETKRAHYIDAKGRLSHWLEFIGRSTALSTLTKSDFLRYRDFWSDELAKRKNWLKDQPQNVPFKELLKAPGTSVSSVNKHFVLVKGAFTAANREADIVVSGIDDMLSVLRHSKANKRELPLVTPDHFQSMLTNLDQQWSLICLLGLNIAASNADIARLQWTHIRDDGVYDWSRDKNIRIRRIPLWQRTIDALREYKKIAKSANYVFTTTHGNQYQHSSDNSRKDPLGEQFVVKMKSLDLVYTFGAFRKSATTIALIAGANETVIKMLLGDAGDEVWRHYGMTVPEIVSEAVESVEEHYFGKTS